MARFQANALSLSVSLSLFFLSVIHASNWIPWPAEQHLAAAAAAAKRRADCLQTANKRDACARRRCPSSVGPSVRPRGALPEQEGKEEGDTVENFRQVKE